MKKKDNITKSMGSFRFKIIFVFLVIALMPCILITCYFFISAKTIITKRTMDSINSSLSNTQDHIMSVLNVCEPQIENLEITINNLFSEFPDKDQSKNGSIMIDDYQELLRILKRLDTVIQTQFPAYTQNSCIYIYLPGEHTFIDSSTTYYEDIDPESLDYYCKYINSDKRHFWVPTSKIDIYALNLMDRYAKKQNYLSYLTSFCKPDGSPLAYISFNLPVSLFSESYRRNQIEDKGDLLVFNQNEILICTSGNDGQYLHTPELINYLDKTVDNTKTPSYLHIGQDKYLAIAGHSSEYGVTFLHLLSEDVYLKDIKNVFTPLLIFLALLIVFLLLIAIGGASYFYQPVSILNHAMRQVAARNLSFRIKEQRQDEYGLIYKGFNSTVSEVESLIAHLTNEQLLNKEATIHLLQEQMNPHFIYNTLETIYSLSELGRIEDVSTVTRAMSDFYRISLSEGRNEIPLGDAIKIAEYYLTIQCTRFRGKIHYDIKIPPQYNKVIVPKYSIQTIVENSIYHGAEPLSKSTTVTIQAHEDGDGLIIIIQDNGIGIPEQKLKLIQSQIEQPDLEGENFGIHNLSLQIRLKFGDDYGVRIESVYGEGTLVYIRVPMAYLQT